MRHAFAVGWLSALLAAAAPAQVLDVPATYPTIQAALDAAHDGDTVLVQAGTYHEALLFPATSITLESAAGAELTTVDATGLQARVMTIAPAAPAAVGVAVRGFTITGGTLRDGQGGGVYVGSTALLTIEDCVITGNEVTDGPDDQLDVPTGGGIYASGKTQLISCEIRDNHVLGPHSSGGGVAWNVTLTDCLLAANTAKYGGGGGVGGTYVRCTFEDNVAGALGGGLYEPQDALSLAPDVTDCLFRDNIAGSYGGGCWIFGVGPYLTYVSRCTFLGNSSQRGGGAYLTADFKVGQVDLSDCIFASNDAAQGDGLFSTFTVFDPTCIVFCTFVGDAAASNNDLKVKHCIARDPPAGGPFQSIGYATTVTWSDVEGGWPGLGNFDADPLFADPAAGDFHLGPHSPCIDAGSPAWVAPAYGCESVAVDVDVQPRVMGGRVDVGADEAEPDCNHNGLSDLSEILAGTATDCDGNLVLDECQPLVDCNGNGQFDACDIAQGLSIDCNGNGVPDECEPFRDCNGNGLLDECDIASGFSSDCDADGVPDECQTLVDCNANGKPDVCDLEDGTSHDCNGNGLPDECDIASGSSLDADGNGWPDECEKQLHVPGEYATIQAAIDAAEDGDAILLEPGTYAGFKNVGLLIQNKAVMIEGLGGPGACIVDCASFSASFAHVGGSAGPGSPVILRGLTVLHGIASAGGAVSCEGHVGLRLEECVFEDCTASGTAQGGGAAVAKDGATLTCVGCTFVGNQAKTGGAVRVVGSTLVVEHCTFFANSASLKGGAILVVSAGEVKVRDSILFGDSSPLGDELGLGTASHLSIDFSDVEGGLSAVVATDDSHVDWGAGMIDADPLFADTSAGDFHLLPGSPCINTGDPAGPPDADGSLPDMGALPYEPWTPLGGGVAGTFGQAQLEANGPLTPGSVVVWSLAKGLKGATFTLVVGFAEAGLPFHGGVLWPEPQALIGLPFDAVGAAQGDGRWPPGLPSGTGLWLQAWFADVGAAGGLAASNGVRGIAP